MNLLVTPVTNPPRSNPGHQQNVVDSRRFPGWDHFPENLDRQLRCAQCHQKAKFRCIACQVTLHPGCFAPFHRRPFN